MKIIYDGVIFERQRVGGISRVFSEIAKRVAAQEGSKASIAITKEWKSKFDVRPSSDANVVALPNISCVLRGRLLSNYRRDASTLLKSLLASSMYDVWHSTEYTTPFLDIPSVVTIHDMVPELYPEFVGDSYVDYATRQKRKCVANADVVITVSENTREDVLQHYDELAEEKVRVIPNAYNEEAFYSRDLESRDYLLYVGGRHGYKGFDLLRKCLNGWSGMSSYRLVVVGNEMSIAEREACNFSVEQHSNVSDERLAELYSRAAAFVYPSYYEGFGVPLLEAMACRCPVVASSIPTSLEVADSVPYYFSPGDEEGLIEALEQALEGKNWTSRTEESNLVLNRYSWDKTASNLVDIYRNLVS